MFLPFRCWNTWQQSWWRLLGCRRRRRKWKTRSRGCLWSAQAILCRRWVDERSFVQTVSCVGWQRWGLVDGAEERGCARRGLLSRLQPNSGQVEAGGEGEADWAGCAIIINLEKNECDTRVKRAAGRREVKRGPRTQCLASGLNCRCLWTLPWTQQCRNHLMNRYNWL